MTPATTETGLAITRQHDIQLSRRSTALLNCIEGKPGAVARLMSPPRTTIPNVLIYKVMGKMFAIMAIRGNEGVILKCDPNRVPLLREQYQGIGHRSHLDPRNWISVSLNADIPIGEVKRLVQHSYDLVCSSLTRKQQAELAELAAN